jgi:tubulin-specific chaperone B
MWFHITHSVLTLTAQSIAVASLKEKLLIVTGTDPADQSLELYDGSDQLVTKLNDDSRSLESYGPQDYYRIHVIDLQAARQGNGAAVRSPFDNLAAVEKYTISEEDYDKRDDTFRKWKERNCKKQAGEEEAKAAAALSVEQQEQKLIEDKQVAIGKRCEVVRSEDGLRPRGRVAYVGKPRFGSGWWIGVHLDEPYGKNNGSVKGIKYFTCPEKYGTFVKPDKINVGDEFVELGFEDELEDEI